MSIKEAILLPSDNIEFDINNKLESDLSLELNSNTLYSNYKTLAESVSTNKADVLSLDSTLPVNTTIISIQPEDVYSTALLCHWDNIYGPKLQSKWTSSYKSLSNEILLFSARQMISSEILRDTSQPHVERKFYLWTEKKLALAAVLFNAFSGREMTMHAFILFANFDNLDKFMILKSLTLDYLHQCGQELKIFLSVNPTKGFQVITRKLEDLLIISRSFVYTSSYNKIQETLNFTNIAILDIAYLHNCLYAHLSQCCRSVVISSNENSEINQMLSMLSLFQIDRIHLQLHEPLNNLQIYSPYIHLQSFLKTKKNMLNLMSTVFYGRQPSALIDLDTKKSFTLCSLSIYSKKREEFIYRNIEKIWKEDYSENNYVDVFRFANVTQSLLLPFISQFRLLCYDHNVAAEYVKTFMDLLQKKAFSLIKSFEIELKCSSGKSVSLSALRRSQLLKLNSDYEIVLSIAELLKPGFAQLMYSNCTVDK